MTPDEMCTALLLSFVAIIFAVVYGFYEGNRNKKYTSYEYEKQIDAHRQKEHAVREEMDGKIQQLSAEHKETVTNLSVQIEDLIAQNTDLARPLESHRKDFNEILKEQESKIEGLESTLERQSEQHQAEIAERVESFSALEDTSNGTIAHLEGRNYEFGVRPCWWTMS